MHFDRASRPNSRFGRITLALSSSLGLALPLTSFSPQVEEFVAFDQIPPEVSTITFKQNRSLQLLNDEISSSASMTESTTIFESDLQRQLATKSFNLHTLGEIQLKAGKPRTFCISCEPSTLNDFVANLTLGEVEDGLTYKAVGRAQHQILNDSMGLKYEVLSIHVNHSLLNARLTFIHPIEPIRSTTVFVECAINPTQALCLLPGVTSMHTGFAIPLEFEESFPNAYCKISLDDTETVLQNNKETFKQHPQLCDSFTKFMKEAKTIELTLTWPH